MTIDIYQPTPNDTLSLEEYALYNLIMAYRAENGLAPIALSQALTATAGRHAEDTTQNIWATGLDLPEGTNLHSWSDAPYFADHRDPEIMWEAPERIGTGFTGNGYEISVSIGDDGTIQQALALWQGSGPHNAVILNQDVWGQVKFKAMGVGIDRLASGETILHVWFSDTADTAPPELHGSQKDDRIDGTGFSDLILGLKGADILKGGGGRDLLDGGKGRDVLTGGDGPDTFRFADFGGDRLTDFTAADQIALKRSVFSALGATVEDSEFRLAGARDADDHLIYQARTGKLFYDANGDGAGGMTLIAILDGAPDLSASDFLMV
ncbi:hypothetical protein SAMN04488103_10951 [Gemmobacter aquatilis]|uniref:Hemolysin-type calcium-binding repeat-containing protein n=1 Tax=Gemmobacter aquatilis TaxID=933059 RepID=A0A1H8KEG6_9RHOB|nr:hypothetical protein [Gemmobacter aquatilis]SEN90946.1 hypothetical protein SAMN04488103_10951 [Gemmobacter aquatilis]